MIHSYLYSHRNDAELLIHTYLLHIAQDTYTYIRTSSYNQLHYLYAYTYVHTNVRTSSVLSRLFLGDAAPPIVQIYPTISVSEAAAPPIRMMACKADLYSIIITKQLYTCKYTAIDCTIVTHAEDRGWIGETSALDSTPCTPISKFWREYCVLHIRIAE